MVSGHSKEEEENVACHGGRPFYGGESLKKLKSNVK